MTDSTETTIEPRKAEWLSDKFTILVEVVPPAGPDPERVLTALETLNDLPVDAFSVATNPVAKPRMSAMALCALIQQRTGRPAILHCTTRDHNRLSLQAELWGARALGIDTVMAATGDFVALDDRSTTSTVRDVDVFNLIRMIREAGLFCGAVLDTHPEANGLQTSIDRLRQKETAGARYIVTQPVYDEAGVETLYKATRKISIPIILGVLPLRTPRHAEFLHSKVAGIAVPEELRRRMQQAADPVAEGIANARDVVAMARTRFAGVCLMPPFDHYEVMRGILRFFRKAGPERAADFPAR